MGILKGEGRKLVGQKHSAGDAEDAGTRCAGAGKEGPLSDVVWCGAVWQGGGRSRAE